MLGRCYGKRAGRKLTGNALMTIAEKVDGPVPFSKSVRRFRLGN